jgi:PAS domain S-box-containing protein
MLPPDLLLRAASAGLLGIVAATLAVLSARRGAHPGAGPTMLGAGLMALAAAIDLWGSYADWLDGTASAGNLAALVAGVAGALLLLVGLWKWLRHAFALQAERDDTRTQNLALGQAAQGQALRVWKAEQELARGAEERAALETAIRGFEQRWRSLVEHAPSLILTIDAQGKVLFANRATLTPKGDALLGTSLARWLPPEGRLEDAMKRVFVQAEPVAYEVAFRPPDAPATWYAVRIGPVRREGGTIAGTVIATDITEWKKAEVAQLHAREQQRDLERLEQLSRFKTQLLNTAAHELSNPLSPIKTQLFILGRSAVAKLDDRERQAFTVVERNVQRLAMLISDMRDLTRVQAGRLTLLQQDVDLGALLAEAALSFEEPARNAGVTIAPAASQGLLAQADGQRLMQVLFNLCSNAIKFTPRDGRVTLEAQAQGDVCVVRIRDTGRGLDREQIAKLFQPFAQVHDPGEVAERGTGLGLYICKGIVEAHGGRIWVESDGHGKGSSFCFTVPFQWRALAPTSPMLPAAAASAPAR